MYENIISQIVDAVARWQVKVLLPPLVKFVQLLLYVLSLLTNDHQLYPKQITVTGVEKFDYIVVGGGTAGCVLANRLSENPRTTVLLIESGGIPSILSNTPGFFPLFFTNSPEDWQYYSNNDEHSKQAFNRRLHMTAGKVLGGSSGINLMIYVRGANADYEKWKELGNEGWGWDDVLPYFKKSEYLDDIEIYRSNSSSLHGKHGPMKVRRPEWKDRSSYYFQGFKQNGRTILQDTNGYKHFGYSIAQYSTDDHFRQSTAISYLKPAKNRRNLKLLLHSTVTKIIFNKNKEATGVEVQSYDGKKVIINARKEVIISAGTFNSPKLLMISGIGPKDHLEENKCKVIVDSPNVGKNLTDSPIVPVALTGKGSLLQNFGYNTELFTNLNMFSSPVIVGHESIDKSKKQADYQMNIAIVQPASLVAPVFCSSIFELSDEICISLVKAGLLKESLFAVNSLLHAESRGSVKLNCSNPTGPPVITLEYYTNANDLERHARYMLDYISVVDTEHFRGFNSEVAELNIKECMHHKFSSLEYWKCNILNTATTMWNFFGTCTMGPLGVVDARLRVRGVKRCRVVDASIIPSSVSGNLQAAVVMIAEKASDMIKEDNPHCN